MSERNEKLDDLEQPLTELNEDAAQSVRGGNITQDVTVNKAKTADKAFNAMDAYIRG